jgi:hypothetical protein
MKPEQPDGTKGTAAPKPVCFMVTLFRSRKVEGAIRKAPTELNCDALWDICERLERVKR